MLGKKMIHFNVRIIKMLLQCTLHNSGLNNVFKLTEIWNIVERAAAIFIICITSGMSADILTRDSNATAPSKEKILKANMI